MVFLPKKTYGDDRGIVYDIVWSTHPVKMAGDYDGLPELFVQQTIDDLNYHNGALGWCEDREGYHTIQGDQW